MSAQIRDDDEGPVDRIAVITNLLTLRLEEFVDQLKEGDNARVVAAVKASIEHSLKTMGLVFRVPRMPVVRVTADPKSKMMNLDLLHPDTQQPITVGDWLAFKKGN